MPSQRKFGSFSRIKITQVIYIFYILVNYGLWFLKTWSLITDFESGFRIFLFASTYLIGFWINITFLYKPFLIKKKYALYLVLSSLSFFILYIVQGLIYAKSLREIYEFFMSMSDGVVIRDMFVSQFIFISICGLGICIHLFGDWIEQTLEIANLKSEKAKAELTSLKNQLSPHFLFNTLNMVYVMIKSKPSVASEIVLEMSELLRYQLYGSSQEEVYLHEEVDFINNLLGIEKMRKENLKLSFETDIDNPYTKILPLILSPLVENALKHGSQEMDAPEIKISLTCLDNTLKFTVVNSYLSIEMTDETTTKTGLENLRKRLNLVYKKRVKLNTKKENGFFYAHLLISQLHD